MCCAFGKQWLKEGFMGEVNNWEVYKNERFEDCLIFGLLLIENGEKRTRK